jgi:hypothetical protein
VYFSQIYAEKRIIIYMLPIASESPNLGRQGGSNRGSGFGGFCLCETDFIRLRMVFKPKMGKKM